MVKSNRLLHKHKQHQHHSQSIISSESLIQLGDDESDNCDHNFGTFDDFGVKNDQKVSHLARPSSPSTVTYVSSASEIIEWPCDVDHETGVARNHIFQKN